MPNLAVRSKSDRGARVPLFGSPSKIRDGFQRLAGPPRAPYPAYSKPLSGSQGPSPGGALGHLRRDDSRSQSHYLVHFQLPATVTTAVNRPTLLIASTNPGKLREYREILSELSIDLKTLADVGISFEVDETGTTFRENATLKARGYAQASGLVTFAEDSGLEIDALDGEPGVYSARWGNTSDYDLKHRMILQRMAEVPLERRTARYVSEAAIVDISGRVWNYRGTVEGRIAMAPAGDGGFGFDPIFELPRFGRTMAQLSAEEKHAISHRGHSTRRALPRLRSIFGLPMSTRA
jgi:XTP/dITP diphosphohydrolase